MVTVPVLSPAALRVLLLVMVSVPTTSFFCLLGVANEAGVPFLGFILWQCVAAALVFGVILLARRTPVPLSRAHMRYYGASAVFGLLIPYVAMTTAAREIPVGLLGMAFTIEPAITYLLALVLMMERFHLWRFAGLLLGIAGLLLILLPQASLPTPAMLPWVLVSLAVPVSWALWSNWVAYDKPPEVDSAVTSFAMLVMGAVLLVVPVAWRGELWWFGEVDAGLWWLMPLLTVFNVWLWLACFETIRIAGPVFYSSWTFIGTPLSIAAGMAVFGERHSVWIWSALVLLMGSLYLVNATMASARRRQSGEEA